MELEQRIEPYLKKFNLSGYHLGEIICAHSSEATIFSLKKPGCIELVIKVKELNHSWGNTLDERISKASKEALEMIRLCENPNVVDVLAHFALIEKEPCYYCIIEKRFIPLDTYLNKFLTKNTVTDINLAVRLGVALCNVLHSCQSFNPNYRIIHRDIKFGNIFINETPAKGILLGDFGIAIDLVRTEVCSFSGTENTMSPEVYMGKKANHLSDIYSVGVLMYCLMNNRRYPYTDKTSRIIAWNKFYEKSEEELLPPPANGSAELKSIVTKAVRIKKEARWDSARSFFNALSQTEEFFNLFGRANTYIQSLDVYDKHIDISSEEITQKCPPVVNKDTSRFIISGKVSVGYDDGFTYCGEWKNGFWHGSGEILYSDGKLLKGTFDRGCKISGAYVKLSDQERNKWYLRTHKYQKHFFTKGIDLIPDGESVIVSLSPNAVYNGGWKNGKRSGHGTLFMKDGYTAEGEWDEDCFVSGTCFFNGEVS